MFAILREHVFSAVSWRKVPKYFHGFLDVSARGVELADASFWWRLSTPWHHGAFSGAWRWQDFATVCSRAAIRDNIFASCIPEGPRTGKAPLPGNISPPCIKNELTLARFARHVSEMPCKSPFGNTPREDLATKGIFSLHRPLESCTTRESCHSWVFRLGVAGEVRGEAGRGVPARRMRLAHAPPRFVRGGAVLSRAHLMQL